MDEARFVGQVLSPLTVRRYPDGKARLRMVPQHRHSNMSSGVHGGVVLSLIDVALFATARLHGLEDVTFAVTVDLSVQFIGAAASDRPLDAVGEVLKETGRLMFIRGLCVQGDATVAAFSGTIRKPGRR